MSSELQVVWINSQASPVGGAERYCASAAGGLRASGIRSVLLYEASSAVSPEMTASFAGAFPIVDLPAQLAALRPDVVYAHQIGDVRLVSALADCGVPVLRFFHDHKLFCLREGKFTTLGHVTCTRTVGLDCYRCLAFVRRSASFPGVRLARVGKLVAEQRDNMRLTAFVVGSAYMAGHVAAHGFDRARIHVLPLFVPEPAARSDEPREADLLLSVGQLIRGKGHDVLLEAMARLARPARLAIAGTGRLAAELEARAASLGIAGRVTFLGQRTPDELAGWFRRAACVVLPTRAPETFGLVGVEAHSHATPVVASRVGAIPEWLEDGASGLLVPPNDAAALARAIDTILGGPERARRMGEHGRATYRARYLPEHHLSRLADLLRTFSEPRRPTA